MSSSSVDISRSVAAADEFGRVLVRILTDDSVLTAPTFGDDAFGEIVVFAKWSSKAGRLSRLSTALQDPFRWYFWRSVHVWRWVQQRGAVSDSTTVVRSLSRRRQLDLVALSKQMEGVTSWAIIGAAKLFGWWASTVIRGTTTGVRLWAENSINPLCWNPGTLSGNLDRVTCWRNVTWLEPNAALWLGVDYRRHFWCR